MMKWEDFPRVDLEFMNEDHKRCLGLIESLLQKCDAQFECNDNNYEEIDSALTDLSDHLVEHFKSEEEAMHATGFPPYYVHKTEHDSVLQQFKSEVSSWHSSRDLKALRRYIAINVLNWLETHALTMDTVSAQHVASCQT
ncbi:MAG: hemerythrin family protein [Pseudomonadales bacterium]|nr:hemerythrin family protein [Pseudomonadales bacterium]